MAEKNWNRSLNYSKQFTTRANSQSNLFAGWWEEPTKMSAISLVKKC